jgi:hypothetical protein
MRRQILLPAVLLATASTLVACSGGGDGDVLVAAADRPQSPIEEFFDLPTGFDDDQQEKFAEQARLVEEEVRDCMVAQGFEYTPTTQPTSVLPADQEFRDAMELPPEEFVERYGLGITTFASSGSVEGGGFGEEVLPDPNEARVQEMDQAEQDAYYRALYGDFEDQPEWDPALSEEENQQRMDDYYENREPTGCQEIAWAELEEESQGQYAVYEEYADELEQMWQQIEADPRIAEFEQEWAECMSEAGYDFADMETMYNSIYERQGELYGSPESEPAVAEASGELTETTATTETGGDEGGSPTPDEGLVEPDAAALAELREYELDVARANFDCGGGSGFGQPAVYEEVRFELEQQFIDEHRAELEELRTEGGE